MGPPPPPPAPVLARDGELLRLVMLFEALADFFFIPNISRCPLSKMTARSRFLTDQPDEAPCVILAAARGADDQARSAVVGEIDGGDGDGGGRGGGVGGGEWW